MKSFTTPDFWQAYAALPLEIREQAQKNYQLWQNNPLHPSLHPRFRRSWSEELNFSEDEG